MRQDMSHCPKCGTERPTSKVWDTTTCPGCKKRQKTLDIARKGARKRRDYDNVLND